MLDDANALWFLKGFYYLRFFLWSNTKFYSLNTRWHSQNKGQKEIKKIKLQQDTIFFGKIIIKFVSQNQNQKKTFLISHKLLQQ